MGSGSQRPVRPGRGQHPRRRFGDRETHQRFDGMCFLSETMNR